MEVTQHPLNTSFTWPEQEGANNFLNSSQLESWNKHGYFLLENALDVELLKQVEEEIDPLEADYEAELVKQGGQFGISKADALTFTTHVVTRSKLLKLFSMGEVFIQLCLNLIGPEARLYWDQAVYKKPGNPEEFPWHQDNGYSFVEPQTYLTCWLPLTDATIENGCPWVLPGAHRLGTLKHHITPLGFQCVENPEDAIAIPAKAGDVVVFSSLTPHRTGPNLTDEVRKAYILQYCHGVSEVITPKGDRIRQEANERQFPVVRNGRSVVAEQE